MRKAGFLLGQCADTKETWTFWGFAAIGKVGKKKNTRHVVVDLSKSCKCFLFDLFAF